MKPSKTLIFAFSAFCGVSLAGPSGPFGKPVSAASNETAPDNTGKNARDVQGGPLTPEDQSNSKGDLKITQKIRQSLVADDSLSTLAKNVKIITVNGKVTLRGPVNSDSEKDRVAQKAGQISGDGSVINQLEVKSK
ncbi:MAG: BON domain-containing protein [bacterium]